MELVEVGNLKKRKKECDIAGLGPVFDSTI